MCSLTRLYVWVDTAICVSWYSHMCRLIRIYSLKSDAYRVKKRWWQLVRAPRLRSLAFIAREPCREKEGISIKKIPFIALSWHPRFLFYPFELTLSPINIGWAPIPAKPHREYQWQKGIPVAGYSLNVWYMLNCGAYRTRTDHLQTASLTL